jgi:uncharacterized repeat protein (TIGR01451 family)
MNLASLFSRSTQRLRLLGTLACAAVVLMASPGVQAAYTQVYSTIQKGAITFTGNTLALQSTVTAGQGGAFIAAGSASQVAGYPVGTTLAYASNKSGAVLNVPIGATVLYAELIWSGTIGGLALATYDNAVVSFTSPSGSVYPITPSAATKATSGTYYTRSANVTGLVQLGGSGTYFVGGVPAVIGSAGSTDAAGWTLAVAYSDPSQVARNLTLFVGAEQAGAPPASVSGFCTPVAGPVNGRLAVSGIEGDVTGTGDTMLFGPTSTLTSAHRVYGPNNPAAGFLGRTIDNFFASQINGNTGTLDTSGTFGGSNQIITATGSGTNVSASRQGYDITNVDASTRLINSQTTAFAQGTTTGDNYAINALGMQINVTSPIFPVTVKQVNKTSTFVGDQLTYSVDLDNRSGNGAATGVVFFDSVPAGTTFVPGSVTVDASPLTTPNPVANPGDPASGIAIGTVAVGSVVRISFKVNVVSLPASPAPARFDNAARWDYTYIACAGVVAQAGTVTTTTISTSAARLEPAKTVSPAGPLVGGQTAIYTIAIPNTGLLNTAATTLADPIPAGTVYVAGSTKLNGVAVADGLGGVMPFASAALVNSAGQAAGVIAVGATATVQFSVAATGGGTVLNTATIDPDGAGPGTPVTVSAVNSGLNGPAVAKAFAPATIGAGGKTTLTVTLTNPNTTAITGVSVTDNLPGGMTIANPANATTTCTGGTVTATSSGTTLALAAGTIPASGSCTLKADVTAATAGTYTNTIPAGAVSSSNAGLNTAGSQTLTVTPAPSVSKSFTPGTVAPNAISSLSITLTNPTASVLTGVGFSDFFPNTAAGAPGNMTLFNPTVTNTCGGTLTDTASAALVVGSTGIKLAGGTIAANNVCTITVNVKAPSGGAYGNTIPAGAVVSSGGSNTAAAAATLQIATPQVSKVFAVSTVGANATTTMTVTLTNVTGAAITGVAFTDTYPLGLVNTNTTVINNTGCGGTATASVTATNPGTLTFTGGTIAAGDSCDLVVNVQSATTGTYTNTIATGAVSSSIGTNAVGTSATLNVARPGIGKAFAPAIVPVNSTATLTITLSNPTATAMTGAVFVDTLPAGLTAAAAGGTCVGTKSPAGPTVSLSAGTIPANGSCTVTAVVTGTSVGLKLNTIPVGGLTVTGPLAGSNGTAANADLTVLAAPTISKAFLASPILPNTGISTLQIVLANSNSVAMTGASFTDTFPTAPGAMTLADLITTNSCSGALTNNLGAALAAGAAGVQLTGGVIPSNGSCTITVNVRTNLAGDYVNTIPGAPTAGFLNTANGGGSTVAATAPLSVRLAAPGVAKSFSPSTIVANTASTMTLTITNPSTTQAITGVAWSDIFPAGMKVFSTPAFTNTCGGTVTAGTLANDTSIALSGATVPFNGAGTGSCSISVKVTSTLTADSPGVTNTTGAVTSTNANTSATASANLIVTAPPLAAPTIVKSFLQPAIGAGGISTIRFALDSANVVILNNASFTDTLANMSVASSALGGTCVGVTNSPPLLVGATGTDALNLTVPNLPPGGCTVEVQVTSSTIGVHPNSVSGVTTTLTPAGTGSGPVNLTVLDTPTIGKAFAPAVITSGATSTLTFTLGNSNALALTNASFTDTLANMSIASTAIGGTCAGVTNSPTLVVGATGANALNLTIPSLPAGGCTVTVSVTSTTAGAWPNTASGVTSAQTPIAGAASNTATLTVGASGVALYGFVYSDANHNLQRDAGEVATALPLYAKLATSGGSVAVQQVAVNSVTGAYQFTSVAAGNYFIILDDNNILNDITPTVPVGWVGTEMPDFRRANVQVAAVDLQNLDFGLFNGGKLLGTVFEDTGTSGGTANDGIRNGSEPGMAGVTVKVMNSAATITFDTAVTTADGSYTLWIPTAAVAATLKVVETNLGGYLSTGATMGNTGGSYDRASDSVSFGNVSGGVFTGVNFGDVSVNRFVANGQQSGAPGTVVFYPHQFNAGSGGSVSLSASSAGNWPVVIYRDTNCNGLIDAGDSVISAPASLIANEQICIVNKVTIPSGTALGAQDAATLQASFTYTNANPALVAVLSVIDSTTVGAGASGLLLTKTADKATASPGDVIAYTVNYQNNSSTPIGTIVISDATPAFTTFVSAACGLPLPAAISACNIVTAPAPGGGTSIQWMLTGSLNPASTGQVVFVVKVNN